MVNPAMIQRLQHLTNTLQTQWSYNSSTRGTAKMAAGAILIAEGVFGVGRSLISGRRPSNGGSGLFGSAIGVVVGGFFVGIGLLAAPQTFEDEIVITGQIVQVDRVTDSDGDTLYRPVYGYTVNGQDYQFNSSVRSSHRPSIGHPVTIGYSESAPENARRLDGMDGHFHLIFVGIGGLVMVFSLVSLGVSIVLIVVGVRLIMAGRQDRQIAGHNTSLMEDVFSLAQRANSGEIDIHQTAAGQAGQSQGDFEWKA
ncbi:hypothetical protein GFS31_10670 [Leptolyngbya sp. BL0902]|nr:hypothetical protein GFS31_10670 [Leptolyngbya sp. BL0902]